MNAAKEIIIPLLNPNEPEALLSEVFVKEGQKVSKGDLLCTLETTKSVAELTAERDGFIIGLVVKKSSAVRAGDVFCYLADKPDWLPPAVSPDTKSSYLQQARPHEMTDLPENLRITQPALRLAKEAGLELNQLPLNKLITERFIQELIQRTPTDKGQETKPYDPEALIIYGGGGHGKALIDLVKSINKYRIIGVVDDGIPTDQQIMGYPMLGGAEILAALSENGVRQAVNAVGGIGNINTRIEVFQKLARAGFSCPTVFHPTAFVESSAEVSAGVQVFPHAYVGSEAYLGYGSIVNSGAIISHDCRLEDYTNISPGAILAGEVQVGESVLIGMGATINLRVAIGKNARIGNGATVKQDVPEGAIVRAGTIWPE